MQEQEIRSEIKPIITPKPQTIIITDEPTVTTSGSPVAGISGTLYSCSSSCCSIILLVVIIYFIMQSQKKK